MYFTRFLQCVLLVMTVSGIVLKTPMYSSLPAVIGQTVTLTCKTIPTNQTLWEGPGGDIIAVYGQMQTEFRSSKYNIFNARAGEQVLVVRDVTMHDDGVYICINMKNKTQRVKTRVNVLVPPTTLEIEGPSSAVDESTVQNIVCQSCGGKPLPDITWVMTELDGTSTGYLGQNNDTMFANTTGCRYNTLQVHVTRRTYRSRFTCQVKVTYLYNNNASLQLDVMLFPLKPDILTTKLEYDAGETVRITCVSRGSRPASRVQWMINYHPINASSYSINVQPDGTFTVISTMQIKLLREHDEAVVWCDVTNDVLVNEKGDPVNKSLILHVNYAPVVSTSQPSPVVNEGDNVTLTCDVLSRPLVSSGQIWWTHDGHRLMVNAEKFVVGNNSKPWLTIFNVKRLDEGNYVCVSKNRLGAGLSSVISLQVNYSPVCGQVQPKRFAIHVGDSVNMACHVISNSKDVSITWLNDVNNVTLKRWVTAVPNNHMEHLVTDWLIYRVRSLQDYGTVSCLAHNDQGQMKVPCTFDIVKPSKPEPPSNCSSEITGRKQTSIHCLAGFNGGSEQSFILVNKTANVHVDVQRHKLANFTVQNDGGNYRFVVCAVNIEFMTSRTCGEDVLLYVPTGETSTEAVQFSAATTDVILYAVIGSCLLLALAGVSMGIAYYLHRKHQKHPVSSNISRRAQSVFYVGRNESGVSTNGGFVPSHQTTRTTSAVGYVRTPETINMDASETLNTRRSTRLVDNATGIHLEETREGSSECKTAADVDDVDIDNTVSSNCISLFKYPTIGNFQLSSYHDSIPCRRGTAQSSFFRSESTNDQDGLQEQMSADTHATLHFITDGCVELPTDYRGYLDMSFPTCSDVESQAANHKMINIIGDLNPVEHSVDNQDWELHDDTQTSQYNCTAFHNYINIPIQSTLTADNSLDSNDKNEAEVEGSVGVLDNESDNAVITSVKEVLLSPIKHSTTSNTFKETLNHKNNTTDQHDQANVTGTTPSSTDATSDWQHSEHGMTCNHCPQMNVSVGRQKGTTLSLDSDQYRKCQSDDIIVTSSANNCYSDDVIATSSVNKCENDDVIDTPSANNCESDDVIATSPVNKYENDDAIDTSSANKYENDDVIDTSSTNKYESDDAIDTSSANKPDRNSPHVSFSLTPPLPRKELSKQRKFHYYRTDYF